MFLFFVLQFESRCLRSLSILFSYDKINAVSSVGYNFISIITQIKRETNFFLTNTLFNNNVSIDCTADQHKLSSSCHVIHLFLGHFILVTLYDMPDNIQICKYTSNFC